MSKWNLVVDVAECNNCNNCTLAIKDEHVENNFPGYIAPIPKHGPGLIRIESRTRGVGSQVDAVHVPSMCNHCDNAPCVKAGAGAVLKRKDGIVIFDPEHCKGRRDLVDACPYGAVTWNENEQLPQIWIFDAHLLDQGWAEPRCVQVCPTRALQAKTLSDTEMAAYAQEEGLQYFNLVGGTRPRVYYKNLHRFEMNFIAGSVASRESDDLLPGRRIELLQDNVVVQDTTTDDFGEFKFDRLQSDSGTYTIRVAAAEGLPSQEVSVTMGSVSVVLELILV